MLKVIDLRSSIDGLIGRQVVKVGRSPGLTNGIVMAYALEYNDEKGICFFTDLLVVGENQHIFDLEGDSGSLIILITVQDAEKPKPIGIIWGGTANRERLKLKSVRAPENWTSGVDLGRLLDILELDLITTSEGLQGADAPLIDIECQRLRVAQRSLVELMWQHIFIEVSLQAPKSCTEKFGGIKVAPPFHRKDRANYFGNLLPSGQQATRLLDLMTIRAFHSKILRRFSLGTAIGYRIRNGTLTDIPAIIVFVALKVHKKWLSHDQILPSALEAWVRLEMLKVIDLRSSIDGLIGRQVVKVGRSPGLTNGIVMAYALEYNDEKGICFFTDLLVVGENQHIFDLEGDSGSLIILITVQDAEKPKPIGIIWGGTANRERLKLKSVRAPENWTSEVDLGRLLDILELDLITTSEGLQGADAPLIDIECQVGTVEAANNVEEHHFEILNLISMSPMHNAEEDNLERKNVSALIYLSGEDLCISLHLGDQ
ncbi:hypothetical protein OPV22_032484 [Ensete ventricosum]|uniref:Uncharacterized protein n=1 Tax=Ensete ventricosum TaxID=4639 RepID=A0AAV8PYE3_ENSVE|nr:hypothetical protein OPV22_032484 [Ensete ventricosum]